jgi:hypothetical protein
MLFTTMPLWLSVFFFAICFAVKHCASERIERMECYRVAVKSRDWMGPVAVLSTINGLLTFGIFFLFLGWWSLLAATVDVVYHALTGTYKVKRQLSCCWREPPVFSEINALRAVHAGSYLSFIAIAMDLMHHSVYWTP